MTPHLFRFRVQFEDVDAGGVVHHPKYLNFLERARCAWLAEGGYPFSEMLSDGLALVVAELRAKYIRPARQDQDLAVATWIVESGKAKLVVRQGIYTDLETQASMDCPDFSTRQPGLIHLAELTLASVDLRRMSPTGLPERVRKALNLGH
jgi:acyl-CoA thioester hydrolase